MFNIFMLRLSHRLMKACCLVKSSAAAPRITPDLVDKVGLYDCQ